MHCAIWYHLYNLKTLKNTHGGVLKVKSLTVKFFFTADGARKHLGPTYFWNFALMPFGKLALHTLNLECLLV